MKLALLFALSVSATVFAVESAAKSSPEIGTPTPGYSISNCVRLFDAKAAKKTPTGTAFWFADQAFGAGNTVKLSTLGPRLAPHPPHRHVEEEFLLILEGNAEFYLDGERQVVGPMTFLYCPSWHEHGIKNVGDTELKYLVVNRPVAPMVPTALHSK